MIYIVVRQTTDWNNEATFCAQIPEGVQPSIELRNATFTIPYHLYRRELKRIAQLNLAGIQRARYIPRNEVPEDAVVVPTDDDDWFSPQLAKVLEEHVDGHHVGYY